MLFILCVYLRLRDWHSLLIILFARFLELNCWTIGAGAKSGSETLEDFLPRRSYRSDAFQNTKDGVEFSNHTVLVLRSGPVGQGHYSGAARSSGENT